MRYLLESFVPPLVQMSENVPQVCAILCGVKIFMMLHCCATVKVYRGGPRTMRYLDFLEDGWNSVDPTWNVTYPISQVSYYPTILAYNFFLSLEIALRNYFILARQSCRAKSELLQQPTASQRLSASASSGGWTASESCTRVAPGDESLPCFQNCR